jgi:uncharacterized protein (UPF0264 family)
VAKLLVSVRSAVEAATAVAAGTAIVDVKEPLHGSLGRAPFSVWRAVRAAVPATIPISVALGELTDWLKPTPLDVPVESWAGVSYCKIGLAGAPDDWWNCWRDLRRRLGHDAAQQPAWVAVIYFDWHRAKAPAPEHVLRSSLSIAECQGVLFDTWDKSQRASIDPAWKPWIDRIRGSGRFAAVAGSLDIESIPRLATMGPDIVAVRGAACLGGDRLAEVDAARVAQLVEAVRGVRPGAPPEPRVVGTLAMERSVPQTSNRTPWASGNSSP